MLKTKKLAADYFERHPASDQCHITSDGRVFHEKGTADSYAAPLDNTTVESFKAADFKAKDVAEEIEVIQEIETDGPVTEDLETEPVGDKPQGDPAFADLAEFDPQAKDAYYKAKELIEAHGLTAESKSKDHVIAAVVAAKAKLNTIG